MKFYIEHTKKDEEGEESWNVRTETEHIFGFPIKEDAEVLLSKFADLESQLAETRQALSEHRDNERTLIDVANKNAKHNRKVNKEKKDLELKLKVVIADATQQLNGFREREEKHKARIAELETILKQAYSHGSKTNKGLMKKIRNTLKDIGDETN